ncbi:chromate resistance protein [Caballeronia sp. SEWSISQ10-4 2]|uniref:chromate resistance protein ChrB domain-containing protein n=1 Tax=Caballeronia sp. SEWSISQ10-4 2 TaxID=2937438 RepID=UPI002650BFAF|nr:chromate resistance protein ChrB domain-containing protein [Caballeronia sp. SEWSISQ10-4 2]MDN7179583.1 chromate resistance protein [Caballeronia sp. SEWSISQ10-4 2]
MKPSSDWLLLVLTLPTDNATARMRFWRALKGKGCAVLRDGVYLLPATDIAEAELLELSSSIGEAGGAAHLVRAPSRGADQEAEFRSLFDRTDEYAAFVRSLADARKTLSDISPVEITRLLRRAGKDFDAISSIDFFRNEAFTRAEAAWQDFVALANTVLSPGEPHQVEGAIPLLRREDYQGRTWATRQRLWVDRVASAWLIRRFIDFQACFMWLVSPSESPPDALGFDFDGAAFSHIGERVTFEVLVASFGLEDEPGLLKLGTLVHVLDVGGEVVPEAIGFEAVMTGAKARALSDDEMLTEMSHVLDSLLAHFAAIEKTNVVKRP